MDIVAKYLKVQCVDCASAYELFPSYFDEDDESIEIRTQIYNSELQRGWVGNLSYYGVGCMLQNENEKANTPFHKYENVLLQNVTIWSCEFNECPMWKYRFLKH